MERKLAHLLALGAALSLAGSAWAADHGAEMVITKASAGGLLRPWLAIRGINSRIAKELAAWIKDGDA